FQPDPVVYQPDGELSSTDALSCEGAIPGPGFGFPGTLTAGNRVKGEFATKAAPCNPTVRAWIVVATTQLKADGVTPYTVTSHPFRLQPPAGCTNFNASQVRTV